jgi:hypothetical protein
MLARYAAGGPESDALRHFARRLREVTRQIGSNACNSPPTLVFCSRS